MSIQTITSVREMQKLSDNLRKQGKRIGFVPTMGYLHEGHASLVHLSQQRADITVISVFVNPTQFAPNEDFTKYPRDFERDCSIAEKAGAQIMFAPTTDEMYPHGYSSMIKAGNEAAKFEGVFRPTHFSGVATVVAKLFNAVKPHFAVFGQKDYQQTLVVQRMVTDLNMDIDLIIAPTDREVSGLARSSRNVYLSSSEKEKAAILYRALMNAADKRSNGERNREKLNEVLTQTLYTVPEINVEYAQAAHADTLDEPDYFEEQDNIVFLLAVRLGNTRLIDNYVWKT